MYLELDVIQLLVESHVNQDNHNLIYQNDDALQEVNANLYSNCIQTRPS